MRKSLIQTGCGQTDRGIMRFGKTLLAASGIALIATLGLASPATAETDPVTPTEPLAASETAQQAESRAALEALIGTQTDAEIQAIMTSTEPAEGLIDPLTGKVIAARYSAPVASFFSIGVRGPGCATTDACAYNGYNNGYYGTGQLNINLYNVSTVSSGDKTTTFWNGALAYVMAPYKTLSVGGVHLNAVTRS